MQLVDRTNGEEHGCCSKEDAEYYIVTEEGQGTIKRYCFPDRESADAKMASWWMCSRVLFDRRNAELEAKGMNPAAITRTKGASGGCSNAQQDAKDNRQWPPGTKCIHLEFERRHGGIGWG
jgi:hypothetical protein